MSNDKPETKEATGAEGMHQEENRKGISPQIVI